jgi:hypothetical protein
MTLLCCPLGLACQAASTTDGLLAKAVLLVLDGGAVEDRREACAEACWTPLELGRDEVPGSTGPAPPGIEGTEVEGITAPGAALAAGACGE